MPPAAARVKYGVLGLLQWKLLHLRGLAGRTPGQVTAHTLTHSYTLTHTHTHSHIDTHTHTHS